MRGRGRKNTAGVEVGVFFLTYTRSPRWTDTLNTEHRFQIDFLALDLYHSVSRNPNSNMGNVSTQTPSNFNPPPTKPLPSYIPSHSLFPPPTTFTLSSEDTLPGDYSVLHRKLMKQEPPINSWWLQPPSTPRRLLTTYSISPSTITTDPEGWHPDY